MAKPGEQYLLNFEKRSGFPLTPDEIFERCDENMLQNLLRTENRCFEKKSPRIQSKDLSEYFSMWANTAPCGGVIIVGIANDKKFEGCATLHPNQRNNLEKTAVTYCPDASYKIKQVQIHRDIDNQRDFVILFRVYYHKSKVVCTSDGRVFIRIGDTKRELKGEQIRHLQAEKGEISFELEPCHIAYPQDFDVKHLSEFAETVRTAKNWELSHSKEEILELLLLGKYESGQFIPNIACALLFANDPRHIIPGCRIRFLRFSGEIEGTGSSWNAVKDEFIEGNIPTQIQKAEEVLKSQLRTFSKLGKGGKFFTSSEYPEFAWYEAIVNACVHRSYGNGMKNMTIFVKMFDDHLAVESPGAFPAFVTPHNIYKVHHPRNPYLMDAMYHMKLVRCAHEGTRRMRSEMIEMELPEPQFEQDDTDATTVRVILRNKIKQRKVWVDADVVEILGAQMAHSLNENEKRCINFTAEYGKMSVSDAQRLTQLSWPAASKLLNELVKKNIFDHEHKKDVLRDPAARYKLRGHT